MLGLAGLLSEQMAAIAAIAVRVVLLLEGIGSQPGFPRCFPKPGEVSPFAHLYETGGMRRVHLRGYHNVLKRVLLHAGALNLGLLMRTLFGVGTLRNLQGRVVAFFVALWFLARTSDALGTRLGAFIERRPLL